MKNLYKSLHRAMACLLSVAMAVAFTTPVFAESKTPFYEEAVTFLTVNGLAGSVSGEPVEPDEPMTRAQFVYWVAINFGYTPAEGSTFADISGDSAEGPYIQALADVGVLSGYADGTFRPDQPISRAEALAILNRAGSLEGQAKFADALQDVETDAWYSGAVGTMYNLGVTQGRTPDAFDPHAPVTQGEAAVFLYRLLYTPEYIDAVSGETVTINGRKFRVSPELSGLFQSSNEPALTNARIRYVNEGDLITRVDFLELTQSGNADDVEPLVLDGGGAVINGHLFVGGDHIAILNLEVGEDFVILPQVQTMVLVKWVIVGGHTTLTANSVGEAFEFIYDEVVFGTGLTVERNANIEYYDVEAELESASKGEVRIASLTPKEQFAQFLKGMGQSQIVQNLRQKFDDILVNDPPTTNIGSTESSWKDQYDNVRKILLKKHEDHNRRTRSFSELATNVRNSAYSMNSQFQKHFQQALENFQKFSAGANNQNTLHVNLNMGNLQQVNVHQNTFLGQGPNNQIDQLKIVQQPKDLTMNLQGKINTMVVQHRNNQSTIKIDGNAEIDNMKLMGDGLSIPMPDILELAEMNIVVRPEDLNYLDSLVEDPPEGEPDDPPVTSYNPTVTSAVYEQNGTDITFVIYATEAESVHYALLDELAGIPSAQALEDRTATSDSTREGTGTISGGSTHFTLTGLTPDSNYVLYAAAEAPNGSLSAVSSTEVYVSPVEPTVTNVTYSIEDYTTAHITVSTSDADTVYWLMEDISAPAPLAGEIKEKALGTAGATCPEYHPTPSCGSADASSGTVNISVSGLSINYRFYIIAEISGQLADTYETTDIIIMP